MSDKEQLDILAEMTGRQAAVAFISAFEGEKDFTVILDNIVVICCHYAQMTTRGNLPLEVFLMVLEENIRAGMAEIAELDSSIARMLGSHPPTGNG